MTGHPSFQNVVLVTTRPQPPSGRFREAAQTLGVQTMYLPLIEVRYRTSAQVFEAVQKMEDYDYVMATSSNALRSLASVADLTGVRLGQVAPTVLAVGQATRRTAEGFGMKAVTPDDGKTSGDLLDWMLRTEPYNPPKRILVPRGQLAEGQWIHEMTEAGYEVTEVICYDTVETAQNTAGWEQAFASGQSLIILLYSPSAAEGLARHYAALLNRYRNQVYIAVVGPTTARAANRLGLTVWCTADRPSDESVVQAIAHQLRSGSDSVR